MTNRERFFRSILFEPVDRPARTDAFLLVEEAFGKAFPSENNIENSTGKERDNLLKQCAEIHLQIACHYDYDAIFAWHPFTGPASLEIISMLKHMTCRQPRAIIGMVPGAFWALEQIQDHTRFAIRLYEDMPGLHNEAQNMLDAALKRVHDLKEAGADVAYIPNDQAFNTGPYFSPSVYQELVLPYAQKLFAEIRKLGLIGVYHTDGNIMSLLHLIMETGAHALQSIDPMAGMDIKKVKELTYGRLALIGNVQCSFLQQGPKDAIAESARYCLRYGAQNGGYVFMASNSIFPGIPLENYHVMQAEYDKFVAEQIESF